MFGARVRVTHPRRTLAFVRDFRQDVDRALFAFTMTPEQRARWVSTQGAHPSHGIAKTALIAARLR